MQINDIGTISPSGRNTHVHMQNDTGVAVVPADHPNPLHAATRALMLFLAEREWKSGETLFQARKRMADYLKETPPVETGTTHFLSDNSPGIVFTEG